jgi:hypothetical protein
MYALQKYLDLYPADHVELPKRRDDDLDDLQISLRPSRTFTSELSQGEITFSLGRV